MGILVTRKSVCVQCDPQRLYAIGKLAILLVVLISADCALAAANDPPADAVLGQPDFASNNANQGAAAPSAKSMNLPSGAAIDPRTGRLYVCDSGNNRVLSWPSAAAFTNNQAADKVFGQNDFVSGLPNRGQGFANETTLSNPLGVAVDSRGNLWVADSGNNRLLEYDNPNVSDSVADRVLGQPDLASNTANNGGISFTSLSGPTALFIDPSDNLWIADTGNNRVVTRPTPFGGFGSFNLFGQPDGNSGAPNNGGISAKSLLAPEGVVVDAQGNVTIFDTLNNRGLFYQSAGSFFDPAATFVLSQPNATSSLLNKGNPQPDATTLNSPGGAAFDPGGQVYVADIGNNRVLAFGGSVAGFAVRVFGQPDMTSGANNQGGVPSASTLSFPRSIAFDAAGNLFVADRGNNRVLRFNQPSPNPVPTIGTLLPDSIGVPATDCVMSVNGTGFVPGAVVNWNATPLPTTFFSKTRLNVSVPASLLTSPGSAAVTVTNPAPGGGLSPLRVVTLYPRVPGDTVADRVLGQGDFSTAGLLDGISPRTLFLPFGVAVDKTGRFWVSDISFARILSWPDATAFTNGQAADAVIGQADLNSAVLSATANDNTLNSPERIAFDSKGNLYVADTFNHRVLEFDAPIAAAGAHASRVFGQLVFTTKVPNNGGVSASSLSFPQGVAVDSADRLYVADTLNHRVLIYDTPLTSSVATRVIGQPDFTSNTANNAGLSASTLSAPNSVVIDAFGNLYVSDSGNNRVLEYDAPVASSAAARRVFGQNGSFTTGTANNGGISAATLGGPADLALDRAGNLYISDSSNSRVLEFDAPLTTDTVADRVFGQGHSFISSTANNGGVGAGSFFFPLGVCVDAKGNLYVADIDVHRVLAFDHPVSTPPVFSATPTATPNPAALGQSVSFSVTATTLVSGATLSFTWDFGDGHQGSGAAPTHAYDLAGTYTVQVTASDGIGDSASASVSVTVASSLPLTSGPTATPSSAAIGEPVAFMVAATSLAGVPVFFSWDFGDGSTGSGDGPTHAYAAAGTFTVNVTADDIAGNTGTGSVQVVVNPSLSISKVQIKLNFAKGGSDAIAFTGVLPIPSGFKPGGKVFVVQVGGSTQSFTLPAKGTTAKAGQSSLKLALKSGAPTAAFAVSMKGSFATALADEGLLGTATVSNQPHTIVFSVQFSGGTFEAARTVLYSAIAGKAGSAR
ncbi:MAG TPA: PKD domain-containing protein [Planctomycetota bacterium]|jgi:sugar lactone lactonase YvrE